MRRNPLLMTVMGNPERRYRENPFVLIDSGTLKIIRTWKGSMMDRKPWLWAQEAARRIGRDVFVVAHPYVPRGFKAGIEVSKMFFAGGPWQVVDANGRSRAGDWSDLSSPNPSLGASLVGGMAGAIVTRALSNPASGPVDETAARELELYIENDSQLYRQQFTPIVKLLIKHRAKGTYDPVKAIKLFMYLMDNGAKKYVREFGTRGQRIDAMFNRATRLEVARRFRDSFETEAGLGNYDKMTWGVSNNPGPRSRKSAEAALDKAISHAWHTLMSGVQVPIMDIPRIFRDIKLELAGGQTVEQAVIAVGGRYRVNRNPAYSPWAVCRSMQKKHHWSGAKTERCIRKVKAKANPGPKHLRGQRKVTMPIERFAKIVKAQRDPALWRDFVAKCKGYYRWSHGTWPKKVTVEAVKKAGVRGIWIAYDMGREPEKTYIMPKGTKRKGAWKHPWSKMPQLKGDPEAGFILTKMVPGNKLTDFLHG